MEFKNNNLKKNFELNLINNSNDLKDLRDDSFLSNSKGSYNPPDDALSYHSTSFIQKKLIGKQKNSKRRQSFTKEGSDNKYLNILRRRSFHMNNIRYKKYANYKAIYKDSFTYSESEDGNPNNYEYPTNIFNQIFFAWTIKLFRLAQKNGQLKMLNLGKFSGELSPDKFLKEILPEWEYMSSNNKSNPLLKTIIKASLFNLIFIFFMCFLVSFLDIMTIIYYRQILLLFETRNKETNVEIYFPLLTSIVILLSNKLFHIFLLRFFQFYSLKFGAKITIQINTLIYDKLLKISPYASISEGNLVNFIQLDAEKLGDFFSYIPVTIVLPIKILFFVYLLFRYLGLTFIFGLIAIICILYFSVYSQGKRAFFQKELLKYKDQRMKATTQLLNSIKIIKFNCWENFYYKRIKEKRKSELDYLKKMENLNLNVNGLSSSTSNITSLISILAYATFSSEMSISNILTSLYIFNSLGEPFFLIPEYISGLFDSMISLKRLEKFLFSKEYNKNQIIKNNENESKYAIFINNLDFGIVKSGEDNEEEIEKKEEKKDKSNNSEEDSEDRELDDFDEDSEKSVKIRIHRSDEFRSSDFIKASAKIKHTLSERDLTKLISTKQRKKKFYSQKRLSKSSANIAQFKNRIHEVSHFNPYNENLINEQDAFMKEEENEYKSSVKASVNEESQSIMESNLDNKQGNKNNNENKTMEIPLLTNINLKIEYGDLIGIYGITGSGKTSLLNAICNNLDILNKSNNKNDKMIVNGTISYTPQTPWIINDTIKGNIILNKSYEEELYQHVIGICELEKDLLSLQGGDFTEIGDKGEYLSSGQKIRISIARAVYSNSDIYLFDDPLSSLDPSIKNNIFRKVIKGYLKSKTVLLVTNELQYIPEMKHVIHMHDGVIDFIGTAEEAMQQYFYLEYFKDDSEGEENIEKKKKKEIEKEKEMELERENEIKSKNNINIGSRFLSELNDTDSEGINKFSLFGVMKQKRTKYTYNSHIKKANENNSNKDSLMIDMESLKVIINYSGGLFFVILLILINIIWKLCESGSDYILMVWSSDSKMNERKNKIFLTTYALISLGAIIFIFSRNFAIVRAIMEFNQKMHDTLIKKLLKAPINLFYDLVPRSHILNRLSKDLDSSIKFFWSVSSSSRLLFELLSCLIIAFLFNVFCVIPYPLMLFMEYRIFCFYIKGGRALNSLETVARSPITTKFSETLNGISTIRGFEYQENFRKNYHKKLNDFYKVLIYQHGTTGWFALNLDLVCFFLLFFILTFSWIFEKLVNPIVLGLLIGYTLRMIENTYGLFEQYINVEKMFSSVVNCEAYTHIVQENISETPLDKKLIKEGFPKRGKIEFVNLYVRYRPDSQLVLKNINFTIEPGQKIGIVGRTGSGKTTLCLSLFRILEASTGKILIDNQDISQIGLELLRESIAFIPQDPKLIDGTLRENIDPFGEYSDDDIIFQLNLIGLAYLLDEDDGLDGVIESEGTNFSVGEKQLICITRAMLRQCKIIIMDEANSSFDYRTDLLIQKSLVKSFEGCTLITVAHKIKTILGYDKICVLNDGEIVETGSPMELISKKEGLFYDLYMQSKI